jgi:hypothetical protein
MVDRVLQNVRDLGQSRCLTPPLRREWSGNNWTETLWNCKELFIVYERSICSSNTGDGCGNRINQFRKFVSTFLSLLFIFVVHSFVCVCMCVCVLFYIYVLCYSFLVCVRACACVLSLNVHLYSWCTKHACNSYQMSCMKCDAAHRIAAYVGCTSGSEMERGI